MRGDSLSRSWGNAALNRMIRLHHRYGWHRPNRTTGESGFRRVILTTDSLDSSDTLEMTGRRFTPRDIPQPARSAMQRGLVCCLLACLAAMGCRSTGGHHAPPAMVPLDMPRELSKVVLPTYTIEPPDILVIEAIHIVP